MTRGNPRDGAQRQVGGTDAQAWKQRNRVLSDEQ